MRVLAVGTIALYLIPKLILVTNFQRWHLVSASQPMKGCREVTVNVFRIYFHKKLQNSSTILYRSSLSYNRYSVFKASETVAFIEQSTHFMISSADSKSRTAMYTIQHQIKNTTTGEYLSTQQLSLVTTLYTIISSATGK